MERAAPQTKTHHQNSQPPFRGTSTQRLVPALRLQSRGPRPPRAQLLAVPPFTLSRASAGRPLISSPPDSLSLRIYFPSDRRHVARLVRRHPGLEAALRANGLTISAIDEDQDRR